MDTGQEQRERELELKSPTHVDFRRNLTFMAKFMELQVSTYHKSMNFILCTSVNLSC